MPQTHLLEVTLTWSRSTRSPLRQGIVSNLNPAIQKIPLPAQDVRTLGQALEDVISGLPEGDAMVALGSVLERLERDGFLLVCVFLGLPFVVPVSIPGLSIILGLFIFLIGLSMCLKVTPPLPKRLLGRQYPASRLRAVLQRGLVWVHRIERLSRPRLLGCTRGPTMERFNGLMLGVGGLLLMAPLGLVLFSNTLPGFAVLFMAIGMLQRDGVCVLLGYITAGLTIAYFALLIGGGALAVHELWSVIERWIAT